MNNIILFQSNLQQKTPAHNTDNKINRFVFVMVFAFAPAPKTDL
jgi:hypothetical protein